MNTHAARRVSYGVALGAFLLIFALLGVNPWAPMQTAGAAPSIVRIVNTDRFPIGVAVDTQRGDAWVINFAGTWSTGETDRGNFSRIDIDGGYRVDTYRDMRIGSPQGIAVNPQTGKGYITSELQVSPGISRLWEFDLNSGSLTRYVDLGQKGFGVAVDVSRNRVYVANQESSSVSVVDGNTMGEIRRIGVSGFPAYVAVDEVRNKVYVTSFNIGDRSQQVVSRLNPDNGSVERTNQPPGEPYGVMVDPKDGSIYVTSNANDKSWLTLYNPNFDWIFDKDFGIKSMFSVAINPGTRRFYISTGGEQRILVLNNDTNLEQNIDAGRTTRGIAVDPVTSQIFVAAPTCSTCDKLSDVLVLQDDAVATPTPINSPTPVATATPNAPILNLSTGEVDFVVQNGQQSNPDPQTVEISNLGSQVLSWQLLTSPGSDVSRFQFSQTAGSATPNLPSRFTIQAIGPFTRTIDATIIIVGDAATGTQRSPQTMKLRIAVTDQVRKNSAPVAFKDTLPLTLDSQTTAQGQTSTNGAGTVITYGPTPDPRQHVDLNGAVPIAPSAPQPPTASKPPSSAQPSATSAPKSAATATATPSPTPRR